MSNRPEEDEYVAMIYPMSSTPSAFSILCGAAVIKSVLVQIPLNHLK